MLKFWQYDNAVGHFFAKFSLLFRRNSTSGMRTECLSSIYWLTCYCCGWFQTQKVRWHLSVLSSCCRLHLREEGECRSHCRQHALATFSMTVRYIFFISLCLEWLCAAAVWIAVSDSLYSLTTRRTRSSVRLTNHRAGVINKCTRPTVWKLFIRASSNCWYELVCLT